MSFENGLPKICGDFDNFEPPESKNDKQVKKSKGETRILIDFLTHALSEAVRCNILGPFRAGDASDRILRHARCLVTLRDRHGQARIDITKSESKNADFWNKNIF